jgi:hypothetical protein
MDLSMVCKMDGDGFNFPSVGPGLAPGGQRVRAADGFQSVGSSQLYIDELENRM